ncbi:hypothetical protein BC938DRAFT_483280 [Jimgerdemannia flammicorona]|uniref:Uncharacterized protein n=1 Tax=Jimgerdemannia flammicorona TaxID=994334 RepID=A0A433QCB4_9FUNG|nr:hypothetical protein BC938DRAFT_483280 [Jimgerdemannia flammicorona]
MYARCENCGVSHFCGTRSAQAMSVLAAALVPQSATQTQKPHHTPCSTGKLLVRLLGGKFRPATDEVMHSQTTTQNQTNTTKPNTTQHNPHFSSYFRVHFWRTLQAAPPKASSKSYLLLFKPHLNAAGTISPLTAKPAIAEPVAADPRLLTPRLTRPCQPRRG